MKKKGFTLIELLAVIVILAIIALIATPLVLKYIETARTNSKITSTQNYMKAVENALASYSITNKGKSYPEGCYEINTLNTDLDISIKGDIPTEGKVCIENNKIDKAMVKYPDNKVIKYEEDKSIVSDEETYESFNSVSNYIIDEDLEFAYDESQGAYVATLTVTDEMVSKFQNGMLCDFIMDNGQVERMSSFIDNGILGFINDTRFFANGLYFYFFINENQFIIGSGSSEITGVHNIKIGNLRVSDDRIAVAIDSDGRMNILGYDFIEEVASISITDEEGIEYYNETVVLEEDYGVIGADCGCRSNLPRFPDIYTVLKNGGTITIEVKQTIDNNEVISKKEVNVSNVTFSGDDFYYWGVAALAKIGC